MARRLRSEANSLYGTPQPLTNLDLIPVTFNRAPTTLDVGFSIGQLWYDKVGTTEYVLTSVAGGVATWTAITSAAGAVFTVTGSAGGALSPAAGDIILAAGTNIASTSGAGHTITINGSSTPTFTQVTLGTGAAGVTGTATLGAGGTIVVATTAVTANSKIFVTRNTPGGVLGNLSVPVASYVVGTSFVINSDNAGETSTVNWLLIN